VVASQSVGGTIVVVVAEIAFVVVEIVEIVVVGVVETESYCLASV
jgi:hypothetical protein